MKKTIILGMLLVSLFLVYGCNQTSTVVKTPAAAQTAPTQSEITAQPGANALVKTFALTGENFKFMMDGNVAPELRVKQGDRVRVELTSTDGFHDFVIDEFNAATERVNTGQSTSVEFTASEKGTFEYYCSVGQHRANGMWGSIIVE